MPLQLPQPHLGQMPQLPSYGYLGNERVLPDQVDIPRPEMPRFQQPEIPDIVRAQFGAGDKTMVGALLRAANGQDSGIAGLSPEYAVKLLTDFGYPTDAAAWDAATWQSAIDAHAIEPNLLSVLEMF